MIKIDGCGKALPARVLHNSELELVLDTSNEWILDRTGIETRFIADNDEGSLSLAIDSSRSALDDAGFDGSHIDLIIVSTSTADRMVPSMACSIQREIGASGPAMDINAGCTGFVYAIAIASQMISGGIAGKALIIGTETLSRIVDWTDRSTCVLFGDGAGAVALSESDDGKGLISVYIDADGKGEECLKADGGGARMMAGLRGNIKDNGRGYAKILPFAEKSSVSAYPFVKMHGQEVFKFAVKRFSHTVKKLCEDAGIDRDSIDIIIPHQANKRIIDSASESLGIPSGKFFLNMNKYGNMAAASIPVALKEAVESGKVFQGSRVMMVGFGAGFTWGGAVFDWD